MRASLVPQRPGRPGALREVPVALLGQAAQGRQEVKLYFCRTCQDYYGTIEQGDAVQAHPIVPESFSLSETEMDKAQTTENCRYCI